MTPSFYSPPVEGCPKGGVVTLLKKRHDIDRFYCIVYKIGTLSKGLPFDSSLPAFHQPMLPQTPVECGFFQACMRQEFLNL
jgi:hypothetical protein